MLNREIKGLGRSRSGPLTICQLPIWYYPSMLTVLVMLGGILVALAILSLLVQLAIFVAVQLFKLAVFGRDGTE